MISCELCKLKQCIGERFNIPLPHFAIQTQGSPLENFDCIAKETNVLDTKKLEQQFNIVQLNSADGWCRASQGIWDLDFIAGLGEVEHVIWDDDNVLTVWHQERQWHPLSTAISRKAQEMQRHHLRNMHQLPLFPLWMAQIRWHPRWAIWKLMDRAF